MSPRSRKTDITGHVFERLTVLRYVDTAKGHSRYICQCACGEQKLLFRKHLVGGHTRSCGCKNKEICIKRSTTHGHTSSLRPEAYATRVYRIWRSMKKRCYVSTDTKKWALYGGRGITVCDRWRDSFENFLADMGEAPEGMSLDRIDTYGNYEPKNCRWATPKVQQRNRRDNFVLTMNSETKTVAEWAEKAKIPNKIAYNRLKNGWTPERAFNTPYVPKLARSREVA